MKPVTHLELFLTENCNLRCRYCFAADRKQQAITPELACRALDFFFAGAGDQKELLLSFWGGEPLLCFPLIKKLVVYGETLAEKYGKHILFSLPTNATLLTDDILDFLEEHPFSLSLSLDGAAVSQNLRLTKPGESSFQLVMRSLELLQTRWSSRLPFIRKTVSPGNADRFCSDIRFFLDRGFTSIAFSPVMEENWDAAALNSYAAGQQQLTALWIKALKQGSPLNFRSWDDMITLRELKKRGLLSPCPEFLCGAGSGLLAVDVRGRIYPCHRFVFYDRGREEMILGSVEQGIFNTACEKFSGARKVNTGGEGDECRHCPAGGICSALCPAANYLFTGNTGRADKRLCDFFSITGKLLQSITDEIGSREYYRRYADNLVQAVYRPGQASRFRRLLAAPVNPGSLDQMADRAQTLLRDIGDRKE